MNFDAITIRDVYVNKERKKRKRSSELTELLR